MNNLKPKDLALIALFAALTAVGALISVPLPFSPIPITFQVLFVILAGLVLGKYKALASQVVYILIGIVGLPVFAGGNSGLGALFGPSGGYLWGFLVAAFMVGWLAEIKVGWKIGLDVVAALIGVLIIYTLGVIQLKLVMQFTVQKSLFVGVLPFIIGDLFKVIVAVLAAFSLDKAGIRQGQFEY